ncbi:aromatic acid exporter family protein [Streptomyces sp. NPDC002795]|uniref:aromatic acid exporter family protein n=1 Tax=Streptomyces sp. NPDC002795 TaxID=3364665 RepID=UPI0036A6D58A
MPRHMPGRMIVEEFRAIGGSARRAVSVPGPERATAVQALKASAAAIVAWALAGWWWNAPMALLAPWTAVVLVHSTVYRSVYSAVQQFLVVAAGTLIASGAMALTQNVMIGMAIALPITVLIGSYGRFGDQGWYAPSAALFVLTYGSYGLVEIGHRLMETVLGAVVGVLVNALVLPPVHTSDVRRLRTQVPTDCARLLREIADGIEGGYGAADAEEWHGRALRLGATVAELRTARHRADEGRRLNPGRRLRRGRPAPPSRDIRWERIADHLAEALRSLTEAAHDTPPFATPPPQALRELATLFRSAGEACATDADRIGRPGGEQAAQALTAAQAAGDRIAAFLADPAGHGFAALGELTTATTRLLDDLSAATDHSGQAPDSRSGTAKSVNTP